MQPFRFVGLQIIISFNRGNIYFGLHLLEDIVSDPWGAGGGKALRAGGGEQFQGNCVF